MRSRPPSTPIAPTRSPRSWGEWEGFDGSNPVIGNGNVTNPVTGQPTDIIQANDDLLAQAALQGQTWFARSGRLRCLRLGQSLPIVPSPGQPESFNPVLSVDDPAMQRYITAAGGTTVAGHADLQRPDRRADQHHVKHEQAWGWDYLQPLCKALRADCDRVRHLPDRQRRRRQHLLLATLLSVVHAGHG